MDYEKLHKETINRLQQMVSCDKITVETACGICADFVPESEDERIRKEIISALKYANHKGVYDKHLAWLEKQGDKDKLIQELGEYKVKYTQEVLEKHLKTINKDDERLRKTTIAFLKDFAEQGYENAVECIDWLEKHEQKPTDKIEPKFHEGDWVVYNNDICQIVKREEGCNKLVTVFGIEKELVNERNLSTARLWTIQDAKDGDVLCSGQIILLFKTWEDNNWNFAIGYAGIDVSGKLQITNEHWLISNHAHPATKEQRDTLKRAITNAGYIWYADKKELKKKI